MKLARQVVALILGLPRNDALMRATLGPVLNLKSSGVIHRVIYVTWDRNDLDAALAPVAADPNIELVRIPEPKLPGVGYQKSFIYQTTTLAAGLAEVGDPDALVLKLRPDYVFDTGFLAAKILAFDYLCAPSRLHERYPAKLAPSPFAAKIWVPWADANEPFYIEDAAFLGLCRDLAQLTTQQGNAEIMNHSDLKYRWVMHPLRFIYPFLAGFPLFARYVQELDLFPQEFEFRQKLMPVLMSDPFFWHLTFATAWVLANNFHIDCGYPRQLLFFPEACLAGLKPTFLDDQGIYAPYDNIEGWRAGQKPGQAAPCVLRAYGRLLDDSWPQALFRCADLGDITPENRNGILNNLSLYSTGLLADLENDFYAKVRQVLGEFRQEQAAAMLESAAA